MAENAKRRVVRTAPVMIVVEFVLMISFRWLPFSTEAHVVLGMLEHAGYHTGGVISHDAP
jgi:hypothetical protein